MNRKLVVGLATLIVLGGSAGAIAATQTGTSQLAPSSQAYLDDLAGRLHVAPSTLSAAEGRARRSHRRGLAAGRITRDRAAALKAHVAAGRQLERSAAAGRWPSRGSERRRGLPRDQRGDTANRRCLGPDARADRLDDPRQDGRRPEGGRAAGDEIAARRRGRERRDHERAGEHPARAAVRPARRAALANVGWRVRRAAPAAAIPERVVATAAFRPGGGSPGGAELSRVRAPSNAAAAVGAGRGQRAVAKGAIRCRCHHPDRPEGWQSG